MSEIINPEYVEATITTPIDATVSPASEGQVSATPDHVQRVLEQQVASIENLTRELDRANERVETFRARSTQAHLDSVNFRDSVIGLFRDKVDAGDLSRETANEWMEEIGLEPLKGTYLVTATEPSTGNTVLAVRIEADDEDGAIETAQEGLNVYSQIKSVSHTVDYDGEGDVEETTDEIEWDDVDDDSDEYEQSFRDSLEWSADEA